VVRVEPTGDSVIAGRGAPGATVEMLRDGQVHGRSVADQSGLFALVPPPLPPGSHEITLQTIAPDGTRRRSRESVTVAIAPGRNTPPLVALTAPDKPTVVLSNPEAPEQRSAQVRPAGPQQQAGPPPVPQQAGPRPSAKIVSVEAEEGGRLFVSGEAAPGATVRLYLNETMIAPGGVGSDGRVSFAIGRGVRPGDYRVRIDDVDPVSGAVKSRAEVAFNVPAPLAVPLPPQASAATSPPQIAAAPPSPSGAPAPGAPAPAAPAQLQMMGSVPGASQSGSAPSAPAPTREANADARPGPAGGQPRPASPQAGPGRAAPPAAPDAGVASAAPRDLPPGTILIPDVNTAIVSRGDNLWRISHRVYGRGLRYTVIYGANQGQIRNPNLIYPGQVFVLPGQEPKPQ
jgi:nucleoid-associated protein YgaU